MTELEDMAIEARQKIDSLRDIIIEKTGGSYGKLLNPLRQSFAYSVDDLITYLDFSHALCLELADKFTRVLETKSVYHGRYGDKTRDTKELCVKTAHKIQFMQKKLKRLEKTWEEENLGEIFDEIVNDLYEESEDKVFELDEHEPIFETELVLERKRTSSFNKLKDSIRSESIQQFGRKNSNALSKYFSCSSDSTVDDSTRQVLIDDVNFESVIEKIATVGVNPTALCTETLIVVLMKMESALNNLLEYPNNQDYCEIFYRADFMKTYENIIHNIIALPNDDVFYIA